MKYNAMQCSTMHNIKLQYNSIYNTVKITTQLTIQVTIQCNTIYNTIYNSIYHTFTTFNTCNKIQQNTTTYSTGQCTIQ